jgi:hypothetical protein
MPVQWHGVPARRPDDASSMTGECQLSGRGAGTTTTWCQYNNWGVPVQCLGSAGSMTGDMPVQWLGCSTGDTMGFTGNTTPVTCDTIPVQKPYLQVQVISTGSVWCFKIIKNISSTSVTWHKLCVAKTNMKGSYFIKLSNSSILL